MIRINYITCSKERRIILISITSEHQDIIYENDQ